MNIKSITDVITNSSSEVFIVKRDGRSAKELLELLQDIKDDGMSGMGGYIEVKDSDEDKNILFIDIDWNKKIIMKWILDNLFVIDIDDDYTKISRDPKSQKIISFGEKTDTEKAGEYYSLFDPYDLRNLKECIEDMTWKQGLKIIVGADYMKNYNSSTGFSDYNLDISPLDNVEIWLKDAENKLKEVKCKFGL